MKSNVSLQTKSSKKKDENLIEPETRTPKYINKNILSSKYSDRKNKAKKSYLVEELLFFKDEGSRDREGEMQKDVQY